MIENKEKGFTLVELLAVIVILAIILVIAVPQIMNVIKDTTKASLESSAKMVASQVENQYTVARTLGKVFSDTGSCMEDWAGLNETDYESCTYEITSDGEAKVTIGGKGKFDGLWVCKATRSSATAVEGGCPIEVGSYIQSLLAQESTLNNGLKHITTTYKDNNDVTHSLDAGIRYVGASPNNYVEFNNEVWRIIGLVDVKTSNGSIEKRVKLIRNESLISSWLASQTEEMFGYNDDYNISKVLNGYYLNDSNTCEYYSDEIKNCTEIITTISDKYLNMIETVSLNIGMSVGFSSDGSLAFTYYSELNNTFRNWNGKVGLIYPSDYGFASNNANCASSMLVNDNSTCPNDNWLHSNEEYWTLSSNRDDSDMTNIIYVSSLGIVSARQGSKNIRPVVYLKPNVKITGKGTNDDNIFKLSM